MPDVVAASLPKSLYAHTCADIDFAGLAGKRLAILGGGASAFDNAQYALEAGVGEVHVFVRRAELPRVNPIRCAKRASACPRAWVCAAAGLQLQTQGTLLTAACAAAASSVAALDPTQRTSSLNRFMEQDGFLRHFSDLDDATKYAGIAHFMQYNQVREGSAMAMRMKAPAPATVQQPTTCMCMELCHSPCCCRCNRAASPHRSRPPTTRLRAPRASTPSTCTPARAGRRSCRRATR